VPAFQDHLIQIWMADYLLTHTHAATGDHDSLLEAKNTASCWLYRCGFARLTLI
jgi:hypothetical protein